MLDLQQELHRVLRLALADSAEAVHVADLLIQHPHPEQIASDIEDMYQELVGNQSPMTPLTATQRRVKGTLEYFLFTSQAEESFSLSYVAAQDEQARHHPVAVDSWLNGEDLRAFIKRYYAFPESYLTESTVLSLHAVGTTSVILRMQNRDEVLALKLVKPRYMMYSSVKKHNRSYLTRMQRLQKLNYPGTARVVEVSPLWILMDLLPGQTLRAYCKRVLWEKPGIDIGAVARICEAMLTLLREYEEHGIVHGDLSPHNILVDQSDGTEDGLKVHMIDFGPNFMINQRVGDPREFEDARSFMAPEVLDRARNNVEQEPEIEADLYSIGMIICEMLAGQPVIECGLDNALDTVFAREYTELGQILSELLLKHSSWRGRSLRLSESVYGELLAQITLGLAMADVQQRISRTLEARPLLMLTDALLTPGAIEFARAIGKLRTLRRMTPESRIHSVPGYVYAHILLALRVWGVVAHVVSIVLVIIIVSENSKSALMISSAMVLLLYSQDAIGYYANFFGNLTALPFSRLTELCMRSIAVGLSSATIIALAASPENWPFWGAIGATWTALNNVWVWRMCKSARKFGEEMGARNTRGLDRFYVIFPDWWAMMMLYAVVQWGLVVLLASGLAQDRVVYAGLAMLVNSWAYWSTCVRDIGPVRNGVARSLGIVRLHSRWSVE